MALEGDSMTQTAMQSAVQDSQHAFHSAQYRKQVSSVKPMDDPGTAWSSHVPTGPGLIGDSAVKAELGVF